jgi:hypothetical protein
MPRKAKPKVVIPEASSEVPEIEDLMSKMFSRGYSNVELYIYYEATKADIDTLKFIKELQTCFDTSNVGSQVIICTKDAYERVGINNCFRTERKPTKWTDFSLTSPIKCLRIIERPRIPAIQVFQLVKDNVTYLDNFIEVLSLEA